MVGDAELHALVIASDARPRQALGDLRRDEEREVERKAALLRRIRLLELPQRDARDELGDDERSSSPLAALVDAGDVRMVDARHAAGGLRQGSEDLIGLVARDGGEELHDDRPLDAVRGAEQAAMDGRERSLSEDVGQLDVTAVTKLQALVELGAGQGPPLRVVGTPLRVAGACRCRSFELMGSPVNSGDATNEPRSEHGRTRGDARARTRARILRIHEPDPCSISDS